MRGQDRRQKRIDFTCPSTCLGKLQKKLGLVWHSPRMPVGSGWRGTTSASCRRDAKGNKMVDFAPVYNKELISLGLLSCCVLVEIRNYTYAITIRHDIMNAVENV